jgi:hypothetical protein
MAEDRRNPGVRSGAETRGRMRSRYNSAGCEDGLQRDMPPLIVTSDRELSEFVR